MKNPMIFAAATTDSRGHGLSLRDYFVAHAPAAPEWFRPTMREPKPPERWKSVDGLTEFKDRFAAFRACGEDGCEDANGEARCAWDDEYIRERDLQWPMFWANEQLNRR